ncbi:hypothetical protein NB037_03025 [Rathayibacter sp. ZW T2_19]|uniref:GAF domain-containing protein n=1 Tax=Rathayibacter rubneri TaxID=2950106 RepID=A0A9X2IQN0_9MICO|nr:hypothetical protein [Rathayibacter rubneri]MCM6761380.1 hypothetical protein [Rathayibacter rubneri]
MSERIAVAEKDVRGSALERAGHRALIFFRGNGGYTLGVLSALVFAFSSIPETQFWSLPLGIILGLSGIAAQATLRPTYAGLARSLSDANALADATALALEKSVDAMLIRIAQHCDLLATHQRVSVYFHHGSSFVMLSRHSANPALKESGRGIYPDHQGYIATTWQQGETLVRRQKAVRAEWEEELCRNQKFDKRTAAGLRMQARSLVGYRLSYNGQALGVLIMESTQPQGVKQENLLKAKDSLLLESLCEVLHVSNPYYPVIRKRLAVNQGDS